MVELSVDIAKKKDFEPLRTSGECRTTFVGGRHD